MSGRIRIDASDVARAPEAPQVPARSAGDAAPGASGEVFGRVSPTASAGATGGRGIWARPKLLFALAGLAAAIMASIITDGLAGYGSYEARGVNPPDWIALLFMSSMCAIATGFIASADDLTSGALGRASIFGSIGLVLGIVGGLIADRVANFVFTNTMEFVAKSDWDPQTRGELVLALMVIRAPAWMFLGAVSGLMVGALGRSLRRALLGAAGGAVGGLLGGLMFDPLAWAVTSMDLASSGTISRLIGLAITGTATGFAIAFAEQAAKKAWLAIERGRLIGKQFIIYRNPTRIGASYSNDVFLFKDSTVQPDHARISRRGGGYVIEAMPGALVRVNGQPTASRALTDGSTVQIGETVMRFHAKS